MFGYVGYVYAIKYKNEPLMVSLKFAKFHCSVILDHAVVCSVIKKYWRQSTMYRVFI
jgi:hypothetical protein